MYLSSLMIHLHMIASSSAVLDILPTVSPFFKTFLKFKRIQFIHFLTCYHNIFKLVSGICTFLDSFFLFQGSTVAREASDKEKVWCISVSFSVN